MPNLVPDSKGQRHDYEVTVKVSFSMVTERGSAASFLTPEENAAGLADAMEKHVGESILAAFTDDFTVSATATATPVPPREG